MGGVKLPKKRFKLLKFKKLMIIEERNKYNNTKNQEC